MAQSRRRSFWPAANMWRASLCGTGWLGAYGGGSYDILGLTGTVLGYPAVAAKAGDSVALFAVGLAGQAFPGAAQTTSPVTLQINKVGVAPAFRD